MNIYQKEYEVRKSKVLEYLASVVGFLETQEDSVETVHALKEIKRNVEQGLFSIVLVGEFSSGKSTFLNALMHKQILPSFSGETTATVNFLRHTSQAPNNEAGIVYYSDGHQEILQELSKESLEKVVSTRGDTNQQKVAISIERVDIFLDSSLLQDGVMLVDSPGLNGVADHHREITERQIKSSHASIFMFSARQPGSKTDFEYLRDLKKQSQNIFLVLNMIDVINPEQETVEDVVNNLRQNYLKQFPEEEKLPKIWPVSAWNALAARDPSVRNYNSVGNVITSISLDDLEKTSRMGDFEQRLWKYLTEGERSRVELTGPVERCLNVLKEQQESLHDRLDALQGMQSAADLQDQKEKLEQEMEALRRSRQSISPELTRQVKDALQEAQEQGEAECVRVRKQIEIAVENQESSEDLKDYGNTVASMLNTRYQRITNDMEQNLRENLLQIVQDEYDTYFSELEERMNGDDADTSIQWQAEKLILSDPQINNNIQQFEEWCIAQQAKIKELEDKANQAERDLIQSKIAEKKLQAAKEELKVLRERQDYIRDSFVIPDVQYYDKTVSHEKARGGLFGGISDFLFGKKTVTEIEHISDDTARKEAIDRQNRINQKLEEENNRLQQEVKTLSVLGTPSEVKELELRQLREQQEKLEREDVQRKDEQIKKLQASRAKILKQMQQEILNYVEESENAYIRLLKNELKKIRSNCIQAVKDLLNVNLNQQLERGQKKLDELLHLIETEGTEREQKLAAIGQQEQLVSELLNQGAELSAELEAQMNDHVEQESLNHE